MSTISLVQLRNEITSRYSLVPTDQWLVSFLSAHAHPRHPLAALTSTAHFRLLSTDFTAVLVTNHGQVFPPTISDVQTKELILQADIPVQVLDIVDISTSKWSQLEAIERIERGEEIRGREVIRTVPELNDDEDNQADRAQTNTTGSLVDNASTDVTSAASNRSRDSKKGSAGPHKLLIQDAVGTKVWAFESIRIERITIVNSSSSTPGTNENTTQNQVEGMQIGCKLIVKKGTSVRRGLIMMTPSNVTVLGGKVDIWDTKWREIRKTRLSSELGQDKTS